MFDQNKSEKNLDPKRQLSYLKYIAEAITHESKNTGTLRKLIWNYLVEHYDHRVDYRDFLVAI
jgi:phage gp29-like protein